MMKNTVPLVFAITAAAVAASYFWVDLPVADYFHGLKDSRLYEAFRTITVLGESQWYLAAGLLAWAIFRRSRAREASAGLFLFTSVAASGIVANLLKSLLGRARPRLHFNDNVYGFDPFQIEYARLSFPSGHAATALGTATVLAVLFPRFRTVFLLAGMIVAVSRVVLTQHYVSDIVAGGLLGALTTAVLYRNHFRNALDAKP